MQSYYVHFKTLQILTAIEDVAAVLGLEPPPDDCTDDGLEIVDFLGIEDPEVECSHCGAMGVPLEWTDPTYHKLAAYGARFWSDAEDQGMWFDDLDEAKECLENEIESANGGGK